MAHQMVKPYSFLLYILSFVCFFFIGVTYAGVVGAGKGQMLAGGAIVLGYGVMGAFIGLIVSLFVANKMKRKSILVLNLILALSICSFWGYYHYKYKQRQNAKEQEKQEIQQQKPSKTVAPEAQDAQDEMIVKFISNAQESISLGMFSPHLDDKAVLHFYGDPYPNKSVQSPVPYDSITFSKTEHGAIDIATAPPWLVPVHLKMDYGILLFEVKSITREFVELVVNTTSGQTAFVYKEAGNMAHWPDFLLGVHSVEFPNPEASKVYVKPLDYAGTVPIPYEFMRPLKVEADWMYVELQGDDFEPVGRGWIRWIKNGELLVRYSLLS